MIKILEDDVRKKIVKEIKGAKIFEVSANTRFNLSRKDKMAVVCRYVDFDRNVKERLLAKKSVDSETGDQTATDILTILKSHSLDRTHIFFQSYDFASSISGRFNGCQKKLEKVVPVAEIGQFFVEGQVW